MLVGRTLGRRRGGSTALGRVAMRREHLGG